MEQEVKLDFKKAYLHVCQACAPLVWQLQDFFCSPKFTTALGEVLLSWTKTCSPASLFMASQARITLGCPALFTLQVTSLETTAMSWSLCPQRRHRHACTPLFPATPTCLVCLPASATSTTFPSAPFFYQPLPLPARIFTLFFFFKCMCLAPLRPLFQPLKNHDIFLRYQNLVEEQLSAFLGERGINSQVRIEEGGGRVCM